MTDEQSAPGEERDPQQLTLEELQEMTEAEPDIEPVAYSGSDFDVEGLVRRLDRGDIVVPNFGHGDDSLEVAGFQRGFVWRRPQMDRFIESLLLGFPIPGIMLVQQADKRYLVLDGQQRLRTLRAFYNGMHAAREFSLQNVALEFKGLTYSSLTPEQRRTLDNTFIQATIVRTDNSRESLDSIYQVFERLNSGGTQLTAHEIRIALYPGAFVDLLADLNAAESWRAVYGPTSPRLRDQELVLRIIALYFRAEAYVPPLKKFLNDFLGENRDLSNVAINEAAETFRTATRLLAEAGGRDALRRAGQRVNTAMVESVVVATMRWVESGSAITADAVREGLSKLSSNPELESTITAGTTTEDNLRKRLRIVTGALTTGS